MVRLLRIIAVFIGVMIPAMTAVLWGLRVTHAAPQSHLLFWENIVDRKSNFAYYQLVDGANKPFLMRSDKQGIYDDGLTYYIGMSADEQWVYFKEFYNRAFCGPGPLCQRVYRVHSNGSHRQVIVEKAHYLEWTADRSTFIYTDSILSDTGLYDTFGLYYVMANGKGKTELLTQSMISIRDMVVPTDHSEVYLITYDETASSLYAVDFENGHLRKLTTPFGDTVPLNLRFVTPDNRWLILTDSNHAYRMRTDGTDFMELGNWAGDDFYMNVHLLQDDILLVENQRGYYAIQISTGKILWTAQNARGYLLARFQYGTQWVFLWSLHLAPTFSTLWIIRSDGSLQRELTYPLDYDRYFDLKWAPDSQDIYYPTDDTLYHLNADWTEVRVVATARTTAQNGVPQLRYLGVSDDKHWVYYAEFSHPTAYLYKVRPDGSGKTLMVSIPLSDWFISWNQSAYPFMQDSGRIEVRWQPIHLLLVGLLLIGLGIRPAALIHVWR